MRLAQALLISLALHGWLLLLPVGIFLPATHGLVRATRQVARQDTPAPLLVRLSPFSAVRPPDDKGLEDSKLPAAAAAAHAIAQDNEGAGSTGDDRSAAVTPPLPNTFQLGIPTARYYDPSEVSRGVIPLTEIDPSPSELAEVASAGNLVLVLYISDNGRVDRVEIEQQKGDPTIGAIVAKQFLAARFTPAEVEGRPVKSRLRIEVTVRPRRP